MHCAQMQLAAALTTFSGAMIALGLLCLWSLPGTSVDIRGSLIFGTAICASLSALLAIGLFSAIRRASRDR